MMVQSVQTLCHGCLSADRDLSPIGEYSDMFTMICNRKARVPENYCSKENSVKGLKFTSLCWECTATLKRMQSFHKQVNNAQTILKFYVRTKDLQKPLPKCLSQLKTTTTNHDFISLIEPDEPELNIDPLQDIKVEVEPNENVDFNQELINDENEDVKEELKHDEDEDFKEELKHDEDEDFKQDFKNDEDEDFEQDFKNDEDEVIIENNEFFDADDDFTYSEDVKCENSTLTKGQKNLKNNMESATTDKQGKRNPNYNCISTPEEICVREQARLSDLVNLREQDEYDGQGCSASGTHDSHDCDEYKPHVCNICHACYRTLEELSSHVTSHEVYRCLVCGHRSPSKEAAGQHVTEHKNVFKCLFCEFCCGKRSVVRSHHKIAHTKFVCDYCGKQCKSKLIIQRHIIRQHMENKCVKCSRKFRNYRWLAKHMASVHDDVDQTEDAFCVRCNKQFKNKKRLQSHLRQSVVHLKEYGKVKKRIKIKCLACDKMYSAKQQMMEHYNYVHLGKPRKYHCSDCDKAFNERHRYRDHRRYVHERVQKPRDKICDVCGRGFTAPLSLKNHMRTHTGERPFACAVCDARFAQRYARDIHHKRHADTTKKERVKCQDAGCDKSFLARSAMLDHYKHVHLGQRTHCSVCDKSFSSAHSYWNHRKYVHQGFERKRYKSRNSKQRERFKCQDAGCDKTYAAKAAMLSHYRHVHLGQKVYCSDCDKNFSSADSYYSHRKYLHEGVERKRDNKCDLCGKGFCSVRDLACHLRWHTRARPYACAACNKRFTVKRSLDAHHEKQLCRQSKAD